MPADVKYLLAIDPGLEGGLSLLPLGTGAPELCAMPIIEDVKKTKHRNSKTTTKTKRSYDIPEIARIMQRSSHIFLEAQQAMSKPVPVRCYRCQTILSTTTAQGARSIFTGALGYGLLVGMASMLGQLWGIPFEVIHPKTWQSAMLPPGTGDTKKRAAIAAERLFPQVDLRRTPKCRGPHDGIVDALLLAEFGRRKLGGSFTDSLNLPLEPELKGEFHLHGSTEEPYDADLDDVGF